jgi:hypothetical protein
VTTHSLLSQPAMTQERRSVEDLPSSVGTTLDLKFTRWKVKKEHYDKLRTLSSKP